MSLNPRQFRQLQMLRPTQEVIEGVHKIDSKLFEGYEHSTPAEQWTQVREEKHVPARLKRMLQGSHRSEIPEDDAWTRGANKPLRIQYGDEDQYEPELWDGHHRLRAYEDLGHTEVPVYESFDESEPGLSGGGWHGEPYWERRWRD